MRQIVATFPAPDGASEAKKRTAKLQKEIGQTQVWTYGKGDCL